MRILLLLLTTTVGYSQILVGALGGNPSVSQVATPTLDNDTGSYSGTVTVTFSDATSGATIHTCANVGSDCTSTSSTTNPVTTTVDQTHICATASKSGYTDSATKCGIYTITTASITYVQSQQGAISSAQTATATFSTQNLTAGSTVVALIWWDSYPTAKVLTGVSDGTHAFTQGTGCLATDGVGPGWTANTDIWYLPNVTGGNKPTITATLDSTGVTSFGVFVTEYLGANGSAPFDKCAIGNSGGTNGTDLATASLSTAGANEYLLAVGMSNAGWYAPVTAGTSYTGRENIGAQVEALYEDQGPVTSGSYTGTMTLPGAGKWAISVAALKP